MQAGDAVRVWALSLRNDSLHLVPTQASGQLKNAVCSSLLGLLLFWTKALISEQVCNTLHEDLGRIPQVRAPSVHSAQTSGR